MEATLNIENARRLGNIPVQYSTPKGGLTKQECLAEISRLKNIIAASKQSLKLMKEEYRTLKTTTLTTTIKKPKKRCKLYHLHVASGSWVVSVRSGFLGHYNEYYTLEEDAIARVDEIYKAVGM